MPKYILALIALMVCNIQVSGHVDKCTDWSFKEADSIAIVYQGYSVQNLKLLADRLTRPLKTEKQKYRAIYTWVCLNISIDYALVRLNEQKRKKLLGKPQQLSDWNRQMANKVFSNLRDHKKTLCTGFAYMIRELCLHAQIECKIQNGLVVNNLQRSTPTILPNHSWNSIKIEGNWYMSDPTWSAGYYDLRNEVYVPAFDDTYFLVEPQLFFQDHFPIKQEEIQNEKNEKAWAFLQRPLTYIGLIRQQIVLTTPLMFENTLGLGEKLLVTFKTLKTTNSEGMELLVNQKKIVTKPKITSQGMIELAWLPKRKGNYTIDLKVSDDYVASFRLKVSR
ncbi:MAG: transglutaminase domain-containing protein [Bacteroidota bacterium]